MKPRRVLLAFLLCLAQCAWLSASSDKPRTIKPQQARDHVGETARVCGQVASEHFAFKSRGQPTFLNLGRPYPHQAFTAIIRGLDRGKFGHPEQRYFNRRICVTGLTKLYRGRPEMVLKDPRLIKAKEPPASAPRAVRPSCSGGVLAAGFLFLQV